MKLVKCIIAKHTQCTNSTNILQTTTCTHTRMVLLTNTHTHSCMNSIFWQGPVHVSFWLWLFHPNYGLKTLEIHTDTMHHTDNVPYFAIQDLTLHLKSRNHFEFIFTSSAISSSSFKVHFTHSVGLDSSFPWWLFSMLSCRLGQCG